MSRSKLCVDLESVLEEKAAELEMDSWDLAQYVIDCLAALKEVRKAIIAKEGK